MMNNDNGNHDARISCEETITEDMGPATWANEPEKPDTTAADPRDSDAVADLKLAAAYPEMFN